MGVSGLILAFSIVLIFGVIYVTLLRPRPALPPRVEIPFAQAMRSERSDRMVHIFDNLWLWGGLAALLIVAVYGPLLWAVARFGVPIDSLRVW